MAEDGARTRVRLGIVGLGWVSPWHGRAAVGAEGVELVACCDIREQRAEEFAAEYGCERAYTDYNVMLREHDLDAVLFATWPTQHREQIFDSLAAGVKNILCEKALAYGSDVALDIWRTASEAGGLVVEGLMWRHHPAVRKVDELIAAGELGAIDYIEAYFDEHDAEEEEADDPARDWRKKAELAGGAPWDLTCYCVDACNHFAESFPRRVMAVSGTSEKYGTINRLHGLLEYENDRLAHIASGLRTDQNYAVKVNGAEGRAVIPNHIRIDDESEVLVLRGTDLFQWTTTPIPIPKADAYQIQLERFAACVRGEATPYPTLAESAINSLTLDALLKSGEERAAVPVEIPGDLRAAREAELA